ncbi:hypothetical protein SBOR_0962 [Sclerotinia borealis F-4128]|uniref:RGS domain-containing protein n=1 Tax=Sclerotinia borealis (strain F-4128) TaxID=1432307 RepID=W9CVT9_SCLBF|nr:hypothetical protein SBOR_0962 [Sclerotinia borealis F-4128]
MANKIDQYSQSRDVAPSKTLRDEYKNSYNRTAPLPPLSTLTERCETPSSKPIPISPKSTESASESPRRIKNSKDAESNTLGSMRTSPSDKETLSSRNGVGLSGAGNFADFFSSEVFYIVLRNPTTAHRFLRFCQSRSCSEDLEFLQKIDEYNRLIDEATRLLSTIHSTFLSSEAPKQISVSSSHAQRLSHDIKNATHDVLPGLEDIFNGVQEPIEKLLASDLYPRFVKHQVTASATMALANDKERYPGLGDCFCLTDPRQADNPIAFASDGFVSVTGYSRTDIISRNCRFLQGSYTDRQSTKRLRASIEDCEETVELLLNYRKNGDPFWNLLHVSPLTDGNGDVKFFLGGQINCSTTIHSRTDVLKILSLNDEDNESVTEGSRKTPSVGSKESNNQSKNGKSSFFKSFKKYHANTIKIRGEAGMEGELIDRIGKLDFKMQVEEFYTAYSKYFVLSYQPQSQHLIVKYYSPGIIDMLGLNLPSGDVAPIVDKDIFKFLTEHSPSSIPRNFKTVVKEGIKAGKAVSVETGLLTGTEEVKKSQGIFGGVVLDKEKGWKRAEEQYVCHFTPCKDMEGKVGWVVLTVAPKVSYKYLELIIQYTNTHGPLQQNQKAGKFIGTKTSGGGEGSITYSSVGREELRR